MIELSSLLPYLNVLLVPALVYIVRIDKATTINTFEVSELKRRVEAIEKRLNEPK